MAHNFLLPTGMMGAGFGSLLASGTTTSSSTSSSYYLESNGAVGLYTLTVTGLAFQPTTIVIWRDVPVNASQLPTIYQAGADFSSSAYVCPIMCGLTGTSTATSAYPIQLTGVATVTSTGFTLPVYTANTLYDWYAYA